MSNDTAEGLLLATMRVLNMDMHRRLAEAEHLPPRLSIGVDIDDVLYPWYHTAHDICERAGITNGITPTSWAPHEEYGCEKDAWIEALNGPTLDGSLYGADPFPGIADALWRLRSQGHYIHLITARGAWVHSETVQEFTRKWVAEHDIPHDSLTFAQRKAEAVPCDYFIDDHVRNFRELEAAGVDVYLLTRSWNADEATDKRVSSLDEFADIILEASS